TVEHRDSQVAPGAAEVDDRLPNIAAPAELRPVVLRTKIGEGLRRAGDRGGPRVAVVQDNDTVVPQIAQGVLDVTHDLFIGVEPVDQGNVDAVLLEQGRLVREEGVAGRLEVVCRAPLRGCEPARARRELERRVDGDLLVGGNTPEYKSVRNADLKVDRRRVPIKRLPHGPDPVRATILPEVEQPAVHCLFGDAQHECLRSLDCSHDGFLSPRRSTIALTRYRTIVRLLTFSRLAASVLRLPLC